ncbi:hypothetical protein AB7321_15380, partial [Providencia rettgeri]
MYKLWIANKNYSSWSLRPWVLLKVLQIPFEENLCLFENGKSSHEKFSRFSPTGLVLMNPLMILVKIIKLRWIHILSYDQM